MTLSGFTPPGSVKQVRGVEVGVGGMGEAVGIIVGVSVGGSIVGAGIVSFDGTQAQSPARSVSAMNA